MMVLAASQGGAIHITHGTATFNNCDIYKNTAKNSVSQRDPNADPNADSNLSRSHLITCAGR